jgi:hypothetical protein
MHDDDWFATTDSLQQLAQAIIRHPEADFFFSAYRDVFLDEDRSREMWLPERRYRAFLKNPTILFGKNIIGAPSVVLYRKQGDILFDNRLKWVVDIEFYIRYLSGRQPVYIPELLINVGLGSQQVTQDCFRQRPVEIPENFYLLNRVGWKNLRNIYVYDAWWRMIRNLELRNEEQIREAGYRGDIPRPIRSMIRWQRLLPFRLWRIGLLSKIGMSVNYLFNLNTIEA